TFGSGDLLENVLQLPHADPGQRRVGNGAPDAGSPATALEVTADLHKALRPQPLQLPAVVVSATLAVPEIERRQLPQRWRVQALLLICLPRGLCRFSLGNNVPAVDAGVIADLLSHLPQADQLLIEMVACDLAERDAPRSFAPGLEF